MTVKLLDTVVLDGDPLNVGLRRGDLGLVSFARRSRWRSSAPDLSTLARVKTILLLSIISRRDADPSVKRLTQGTRAR